MRINEAGWHPAYLNPTFEEILELAQSGWDTCRILINPDNGDLLIASGLGNTHETLATRYRIHLGKRRTPFCDPFILFKSQDVAFFNLEDVSGPRKARVGDYIDTVSPHQEVIKDLIRESGLAL